MLRTQVTKEDVLSSKRLPDNCTYPDVVAYGLILPFKKKYTMREFRKLCYQGWEPVDARWICICSAIYYSNEGSRYSKEFDSSNFINLTRIGIWG